jgi:hypothetical protein
MFGQLDTFIAFAVVILGVSMLITVLNQIAAALLGLRGTNLRWGIQTLLEQVDPRLAADARDISERILAHPLISDSTWSKTRDWPLLGRLAARWRLGSAIKVGELVNILRLVAQPVPAAGAATWEHRLTEFLAAHDAEVAARVDAATTAISALTPDALQKLDTVMPHVATQVREATGDLERWFDSVMDRVSQRFAARMRLWTVLFSLIVAFTLHLDASVVLRSIRSDPELRASLVASADAMARQAEQVLGASMTSIFRVAAERLQAETAELRGTEIPPFITERDGAAWIARTVADEPRRSELVSRYHGLVAEELKALTGELGKTTMAVRQEFDAAGFSLVPDYKLHHPHFWPDWFPSEGRGADGREWYKHLLGIMATAALLSLGAPFWFQTLKNASSLRPVVASREKEERAQRS